jgi:hypothetical protein
MAKNLGILCTGGHGSIPECRAEKLRRGGARRMDWLQGRKFMISRSEKLNPTDC